MKVKIVRGNNWYKDRVGEEMEVYETHSGSSKYTTVCVDSIDIKDCIVTSAKENEIKLYEKIILAPNTVIYIESKENEAIIFKWADDNGLKWGEGERYGEISVFEECGSYCLDLSSGTQCNFQHYINYGFKILNANNIVALLNFKKEEEMKITVGKLKKLMGELTLSEAKLLGISAETYGKVVGEKEGLEWIPEMGKWYAYILDTGEIKQKIWYSNKQDNYKLKNGNIFKTKEIAERKLADMNDEIQQKFVQIENYVRNNDDGFIVDWNNFKQDKYRVDYANEGKKWEKNCNTYCRNNNTYMSEQMVEKVLKMLNGGE